MSREGASARIRHLTPFATRTFPVPHEEGRQEAKPTRKQSASSRRVHTRARIKRLLRLRAPWNIISRHGNVPNLTTLGGSAEAAEKNGRHNEPRTTRRNCINLHARAAAAAEKRPRVCISIAGFSSSRRFVNLNNLSSAGRSQKRTREVSSISISDGQRRLALSTPI